MIWLRNPHSSKGSQVVSTLDQFYGAKFRYKLIRPIIRDLELLGLAGYGFKFFLWDQIEKAYRIDARPDRVHQYKLNWSREALQLVLSKRLKAFSEGKIASLASLCEDAAPYDVDAAVCLLANHSPRNVIRICERIYAAQAERDSGASRIDLKSIDQGILSYCEQVATDTYGEEIVTDVPFLKSLPTEDKPLKIFKFFCVRAAFS